jgi:quercetin dioxygenase-like cupin family protein
MRLAVTFAAALLVVCNAPAPTPAQPTGAPGAPQPPKLTPLADEPVSGNPNLHAVVALADWPIGATTPRHIHPGDEYAIVLEGSIEVAREGEAPKVYKAGQAYHNARDVVHIAKNAGDVPAKSSIVLVIDKGAQPSIPK